MLVGAEMFIRDSGGAPDIAGKNFANPTATSRSVAMMLDFLNQPKAAAAINTACREIVADKPNHTRDPGGPATTRRGGGGLAAHICHLYTSGADEERYRVDSGG